jgi:hypothetical protein
VCAATYRGLETTSRTAGGGSPADRLETGTSTPGGYSSPHLIPKGDSGPVSTACPEPAPASRSPGTCNHNVEASAGVPVLIKARLRRGPGISTITPSRIIRVSMLIHMQRPWCSGASTLRSSIIGLRPDLLNERNDCSSTDSGIGGRQTSALPTASKEALAGLVLLDVCSLTLLRGVMMFVRLLAVIVGRRFGRCSRLFTSVRRRNRRHMTGHSQFPIAMSRRKI